MINNIRFKIIAGKINKIPEFYTIFAKKMADYIIQQRDWAWGKAKILASRPFWPWGLNITGCIWWRVFASSLVLWLF